MRIRGGFTAIGIAKRVYQEARKPENQRRIKSAVDKARSRQRRR